MMNINKQMLAFFFAGVIANVQVEASQHLGAMYSGQNMSGSRILPIPPSNSVPCVSQIRPIIVQPIKPTIKRIDDSKTLGSTHAMSDTSNVVKPITPSTNVQQTRKKKENNLSSGVTETLKPGTILNSHAYMPAYSLEYPADFTRADRNHVVSLFQHAGILDQNEMLTEKAINKAYQIKPFFESDNHNAKRDMMDIDINGHWWECKTDSIKASFCEYPIEIHFYMDMKSKKTYLRYDYKIHVNEDEFSGNGAVKIKPVLVYKINQCRRILKSQILHQKQFVMKKNLLHQLFS